MTLETQINNLCRELREAEEGSDARAKSQQALIALQRSDPTQFEAIAQQRRDHYPGWEQTVQRAQELLDRG